MIDFEGNLQLHKTKVDSGAVQALSFSCRQSDIFHQRLGERPSMRVAAVRILGNEPEQGRASRLATTAGSNKSCMIARERLVRRSGRPASMAGRPSGSNRASDG